MGVGYARSAQSHSSSMLRGFIRRLHASLITLGITYLKDGAISIDNNVTERDIRSFKIGRKRGSSRAQLTVLGRAPIFIAC